MAPFFSSGEPPVKGKKRQVKTCFGIVTVNSRRAKQLGLAPRTQLSPVMTKCCWVASAKSSYEEAEQDLALMMGIKIGHSSLHRLVQKSNFPQADSKQKVDSLSVDGGKIRLRTEKPGPCEWRDYKAVSLHDSVCQAYFQENEALISWVHKQSLSRMITSVGDGHDGVCNIISRLKPSSERRDVLDWYHLVENLYKIGGSSQQLKRLKSSLWRGCVDEVLEELSERKGQRVQNFRAYLAKHRYRLVNYDLYQSLGYAIGSGSVESTVKRIGARVKISGAQWLKQSVSKILHLRCAYLNGDFSLSISA
ncbi:ISKra4 family transposase [Laspinema olomoucense]|uniref:ISKra4 family transposase n=1 Tax=Laspinema olomoucense TaxID=3231600 RepID=UPI0021BAD155|nr:ISKra4 family transposase [Laspinema sp. D3d]MCT7974890.1 ISKra4 family transposase [Laspinema sp. D3d]